MTDSQILFPIMTIKGHEMDNTLHMDESVDNENYIGDSCDNLDDDNISFTSNDLSQKVNHHEHEHEHQDTRDQHQFNVQQQQQNSPYNLENEDGPETHNSDEISSNINMTDIKMDTMEDIEKDDNSMNTYQVNSKQQFNDNQSSNCHRQLTKINKLSNSSTSISTSTNTTTTTKACAKKSFVWKYFHHPEIKHGIPDRSRTQCVLCDSQLAFNASGTTTTMLNHLKSRHGEIAEQEETLRRLNRDSRKNQLRNMILSSNDCKLSPTSINSNSTIIKNNEMINSFNENTQTIRNLSTNLINGNNKYNRGTLSVGQRGRPPGSGRRQKSMNCSKLNENVDFLNQDTITNGNLKAEGNAVYPVTNYQTTLSDQQKAFLNEMLLSAAAAVSASTVSVSKSDNRLNGSFINQTSSPAATSSPSFFASPTLLGQLPSNDSNPTKSPFTLLNNITGLPNIPFQLPVNTPQINCSSGTTTSIPTSGIHELSPSSSSGLGLSSVNSPFETSTITVTTLANTVFMSSPSSSSSPTNSLGYRSITSPGGCSSGGQSNINIRNNLLSNMRTTHKSQEFNHLHTNNILMNGQSLNLMDSCNSGSQEVTNLPLNMQNITQDKEKFLNLSNENNENIFNLTQLNKTPNSSTILSTGINNNSINSLPMLNCPSDMMMSALGSFVHLMPSVNNLLTETTTNNFTNSSMNNGTTMNRIDEINQSNHFTNQLSKSMLQSISPQHHHQHQQQLLMANAWLTNLTNGKFSNYPNNLIDPCVMFNLLNLNSNTIGNKLNNEISNILPSTDLNCSENLKFKTNTTDLNSVNINSINSDNINTTNITTISNNITYPINWSNFNNSIPINVNNLKINNNNNEISHPATSTFNNFTSSFQLNNNNETMIGMNLTNNQQIKLNKSIQDGNTNVFTSSSSPSSSSSSSSSSSMNNEAESYPLMSRISLSNNNNNNGYGNINNSNNMSCLFPNLTYPSLGQDKFSYMNTLPFMMNGINKVLDMKNQEITDLSLDLSTTSTTINNNNIDNNGVTMVTNSNNNNINGNDYKYNNNTNDCNFDIIKNIKTNDTKNCILDMRSNNQLMNDKYSSIEQQMINSSLYSSTNYTVSTKRKRSRPVYISPEKELKRSSIEFNQSFDGEDMKMKRYHTEKTNLSINNHNNSDSCIDDKKSCWKIKQNVQNISEHVIEEHDSDEEHRLTINQSSSCSSSSSSSSMSLTRNTFMQSKSNNTVTRNQLSYHVAQYLIKDMKPPETIGGEGFRKLLSLFTNHKLPTIKEISEITFPELYTEIEDHLNELLDNRMIQSNSFNPAFSFSIELWNTINNDNNNSNLSKDCIVTENKQQFANIGIHYNSSQPTITHNYLYKSIQNPNRTNLLEVMDKCRQRLLSKLQLTTNENMSGISSTSLEVNTITTTSTTSPSSSLSSFETTSTGISDKNINIKTPEQSQSLMKVMQWPVPIITNDVEFLKHLIDETESNIIILPCLVSELSKALLVGLNTDIIRNLIKNLLKVYQCKTMKNITEYSVNKLSLDEVKKSNCCKAVYDLLNWYLNEYSVDKDNSENNNHEIIINGDKENTNENDLDEIDLQNVKGIISVFDTIGQTLEFIHKKDLILTGSMIKPILTNLCDIRLAHESSNLTIVEEFKSTIVSYLMNSFPNNGAVYETLWIASLLDPRFKSQVQDKKPTVIKLLRMKVDAMFTQSPTSNVCNNTPKSNSDNHLPTETTTSSVDSTTISNKHSGLETVFGLNYFPRTSLSEVDRYLREDPIGLEEDPYQWWQTKSSNYPNLSLLAMYYLAISLICITPERLKSLDHSEANNQSIPDIKLNLLTSIYGSKNKGQFPSTSLLLLDLPNINDVFGQGRLNIHNDNQIMYNYLWHNWHLTKFV
uniref:BED-type domain-containing protein n=1 Tax=Schistosoma mansoni TaxID=6183 RepID=A0A3Q0KQX1_SCHMA